MPTNFAKTGLLLAAALGIRNEQAAWIGRQTSLRLNRIFYVSWNQLARRLLKVGGGSVGKRR